MPKFRTGYNYDVFAASVKSGLACGDVSRTQQSMKDEADINVIVGRFLKTGMMPQGAVAPQYADYEGIFDYQTAQNALIAGREAFMKIPAQIRERFHHSPQAFMEFCSKEENLEEMRKMGLAIPAKKTEDKPAPEPIT